MEIAMSRWLQRLTNGTLHIGLVMVLAAMVFGQATHKDTKYGYSVKTIGDWKPVPPDPTEKQIVAKWCSERDIRDVSAQMLVYVFDKKAKSPFEDSEKTAGGYAREDDPYSALRSYKSWIKFDTYRNEMGLKTPKTFPVKAPPGLVATGQIFETSRDTFMRRGTDDLGNYYVVLAIIDTPDVEYAVEFFVHEKEERKYRENFLSAAKSFTLLGKADAPKATGDSEAGLSPREAARKVARENAERVPGWWYEETENYFVLTNAPKKKQAVIDGIKMRLEAIRTQYEKDFPPAKPIEAISIVRVCDDRQTYMNYGGSPGTAGYWYSLAKELVFYLEGEKNNIWAVLQHEAFHQYIYYACGEISPHSWYNEGFGDYYSGAKIQERKVLGIDPFRWREDLIKEHARKKTHVPWKDMIRYTQQQYYSTSDLCYAQGWSMIYFLKKGLAEGHPWGSILPTYLKVIQETQDQDKAVDAAFKGVDLVKIETAWIDFITKAKMAAK